MKTKVTILGGGIIGISTAILLKTQGFEVNILSKEFIWEKIDQPFFSSLYPAASIIPHTVKGSTKQLYKDSCTIFDALHQLFPNILRKQWHAELSEKLIKKEPYFDWMENLSTVQSNQFRGITVPFRDHINTINGVGFDILFVEMPKYTLLLKSMIDQLNIPIEKRTIKASFLDHQTNHVYINCLGYFGNTIVEDPSKMIANAGILVKIPIPQLLSHPISNTTFSYNYHFENREIYIYPRTNEIILGGTRIPIFNHKNVKRELVDYFKNNEIAFEYINGIPTPNYLISNNLEFIHKVYGIKLNSQNATAIIGIRPVREEGIRLNVENKNNLKWINAYGFGGAGVTLSWGTAIDVLRKVKKFESLES